MATSASKEEASSASEEEQQAPSASEEEEEAHSASEMQQQQATVDKAKKWIEVALIRFSEMLEAARRRRVKDDLELRCLALLEKEISHIIASVTAVSPQHADEKMMEWLNAFTDTTWDTLRGVSRERHTLLRRAAQCFHHKHRYLYRLVERFYQIAEHPCRYRMPPQVAEEWAGLRPINWLGQSVPPPSVHHYQSVYLLELYLSMFPYGYMFEKDQLIMKWWCEGIYCDADEGLFYTSGKKIQEKLDICFSNLVCENVITHAAANPRRNIIPDEAETWQWNVDHFKHQFLASTSAELGFIFTSDKLNLLAVAAADHGKEASRIPRRLALHHNDPNMPSLLQKVDLSQTRSLAVSGAVSIIGVPFSKFVNLVVLDVQGLENFGDDDLLRICTSKMLFLMYLSIRSTRVSKLPPEMKELRSLQVLDASYTMVTELHFIVFVATRLYRLDLRGTPIRQVTLPKQLRWLQDSLDTLLLGDEGIINSAAKGTTVSHDIRRFSSLRTLATIELSEQPAFFVKALGDLQYLRVLAITWSFHQSSDRDYCEALLSSIERWSHLESLTIHCGLGCSMEFLGSLSEISSKLQTFKVTVGIFLGVPKQFCWLTDLSFVQITVCKLTDRDMEILRDIFQLKCLILGLNFIPREAIVIPSVGFYKLQRFSIDCPVPWLTFEPWAMPHLKYLQLCGCSTSRITIPLGISNLRSLTEVALWYNVRYANSSSVKMTVEALRKEVAKCRKVYQVVGLFINGIKQDDVQAVDEETQNATEAPSETGAGAEDAAQAVHEITEA
ncbi:unnamed protein product [Urochloa decumbens]|uniref:Disease resistance R13L4/SHOC-2-like LRR domain-containing protein n=1 Tax=Urochloa decumbens TaxID=240449 RepID=A0ABC9AQM4_9POAL